MNLLYTPFDSSRFDKYFVGLDRIVEQINDLAASNAATVKTSNWPPYNIKKVAENRYVIEMAVAGFGKQDLDISIEGGKLVVSGNISSSTQEDYLYKGMSERNFKRSFTLADNVEIRNAALANGMLKIWLESLIPESQKPKKIQINDEPEEDLVL